MNQKIKLPEITTKERRWIVERPHIDFLVDWINGHTTAAIESDRAQRGEPVLWRYRDSEQCIRPLDGYTPGEGWTPLYTAPQPECEPMTDKAMKGKP